MERLAVVGTVVLDGPPLVFVCSELRTERTVREAGPYDVGGSLPPLWELFDFMGVKYPPCPRRLGHPLFRQGGLIKCGVMVYF